MKDAQDHDTHII